MYFDIFITQCQKMFNIYNKEGKEILEEEKVRFLFRKVQHTGLRSYIDALKASQTTGTTISYTMVANNLSTETFELPEYIANNARIVLGNKSGNGKKGGDDIYNRDGLKKLGNIPNWKSPPFKYLKLIIDERKRQGIRYRGKSGAKYGEGGNSNHAAADSNSFKQLKE